MTEEQTNDGGLRWYRLDEPSDTVELTEEQANIEQTGDAGACSYCGEPIVSSQIDSMRRVFAENETTGLEDELRLHAKCYPEANAEAQRERTLIVNPTRTRTL